MNEYTENQFYKDVIKFEENQTNEIYYQIFIDKWKDRVIFDDDE